MLSKSHFIKATEEFNTFENNVPAYYFRRKYHSEVSGHVKVTIAVCGFYELFFNGERITKGFLSPYISNTDDFIYYDVYEVMLSKGENVFGVILGNGLQNNPGGYIWDFDKAPFRSAAPLVHKTFMMGMHVLLLGVIILTSAHQLFHGRKYGCLGLRCGRRVHGDPAEKNIYYQLHHDE